MLILCSIPHPRKNASINFCVATADELEWARRLGKVALGIEMRMTLASPNRSEIRPGIQVRIVEKCNQATGMQTEGVVARILTKSQSHPHGIKVMLQDGRVGRVQEILPSG